MIFEVQNKPEEPQKRYEAILDRDPEAAAAANNLAWLYAERGGDLDKALRLAQTARRIIPDDPRVSDTLGWVYYKKLLPSLAVPEFERSVEKDPGNPVYHYHLGVAYLEAGDKAKARAALQHALKLQPNFAGADEARVALARLTA